MPVEVFARIADDRTESPVTRPMSIAIEIPPLRARPARQRQGPYAVLTWAVLRFRGAPPIVIRG